MAPLATSVVFSTTSLLVERGMFHKLLSLLPCPVIWMDPSFLMKTLSLVKVAVQLLSQSLPMDRRDPVWRESRI